MFLADLSRISSFGQSIIPIYPTSDCFTRIYMAKMKMKQKKKKKKEKEKMEEEERKKKKMTKSRFARFPCIALSYHPYTESVYRLSDRDDACWPASLKSNMGLYTLSGIHLTNGYFWWSNMGVLEN